MPLKFMISKWMPNKIFKNPHANKFPKLQENGKDQERKILASLYAY